MTHLPAAVANSRRLQPGLYSDRPFYDPPSRTIALHAMICVRPLNVSFRFAAKFLLGLTAIWAVGGALEVQVACADKPVFADDFEQGTSRWEMLDPKTWKHEQRDGSWTIEITDRSSEYAPPVRSPLHVALVRDLELGSCEITFRVKSTKDTGNHRDCCVFFNYRDDQHFYYVHLGAVPDPHSGQIMIVNEAPRLALTKNEKQVAWDDQWHQVKLVRDVESGRIAIYFDDMSKPQMEIVDKTFVSGRIGIGSFDDLNAFDDVVVFAK